MTFVGSIGAERKNAPMVTTRPGRASVFLALRAPLNARVLQPPRLWAARRLWSM